MMRDDLPISVTHEVRDRCLCVHVQRAARALARRFDAALKPFGVTSGQYSLLISLNRPEPPRIVDLAPFLAMDRTTLTAALKPLQRNGLVKVLPDETDARSKRLALTDKGRDLLVKAVPVWRAEHDAVDAELASPNPTQLRADLRVLAQDARPPLHKK